MVDAVAHGHPPAVAVAAGRLDDGDLECATIVPAPLDGAPPPIPLTAAERSLLAGLSNLNQQDGIHPTATGARIVADNVWAVLKPLAEDAR